MPRFSVVIPAYNAVPTLAETLDAVLAQRFADWECVIVDDGSTDQTLALARSYADRDARFRILHQENRGSGGAYNTGVAAASGDWVTICSADDVLLPEHLSTMDALISEHPGYDIYSSNGYLWRSDGSRELAYPRSEHGEVRSWTLEETFMNCFFSVGATYRRSLFDQVGGYRENVFGEDYDFWLRALTAGAKHLYTDVGLSLHRVSDFQKSADVERSFRSDISILRSLIDSGSLTAGEKRSARRAIGHRKDLIAGRVDSLPSRAKRKARLELRRAGARIRRVAGAVKRRVTR